MDAMKRAGSSAAEQVVDAVISKWDGDRFAMDFAFNLH
jgi:hypothetical protein